MGPDSGPVGRCPAFLAFDPLHDLAVWQNGEEHEAVLLLASFVC